MKKRQVLVAIVLALMTLCLGVRPAWAADVSNYTDSPQLIVANKEYTHAFEKKGDRDCFYFVSGGGTYKLQITDLSGRSAESYGELRVLADGRYFLMCEDSVGIEVSYGNYEYFSSAGGAAAAWQVGSFLTDEPYYKVNDDTGDLITTWTTSLGTRKAGKNVAIWFTGDYKGKYKFKLIGKAAAKSEIKKTSNPVKAKATKASVTVPFAKVKKAKLTLSKNYIKITKRGAGTISFKNVSTQAKARKLLVNAKNGKVTIPKGTKKGTYVVKVKVVFSGDISHKAGSATISYKIVVK
mgnify:CR=1 FL=1